MAYVVTSETVKAKSSSVEENRNRHEQRRKEAHTKRKSEAGNLHHWKLSQQRGKKSEDLKIDWTRGQETVETSATTAREQKDLSVQWQRRQDPTRHAGDKEHRQMVRKTKTEQHIKAAKKMGNHFWRRRRLLKRKYAQDNWSKDSEAGRAPSEGKRATYMDTTAVFMDNESRRADDQLREPLQRQEGERDRGQSSS